MPATSPLHGVSTVNFFAADHAAARKWYTEFLGVEPYFERPGYVEFRIGDHQDELGIIDSAYVPVTQSVDGLRIERAALHLLVALLLENRDAILDDEIGSGGQRCHRGERDHQPGGDAHAPQREPRLQADELAFEQITAVPEHAGPSPPSRPTPASLRRVAEFGGQFACPCHVFL